jgi:hypothetical protein
MNSADNFLLGITSCSITTGECASPAAASTSHQPLSHTTRRHHALALGPCRRASPPQRDGRKQVSCVEAKGVRDDAVFWLVILVQQDPPKVVIWNCFSAVNNRDHQEKRQSKRGSSTQTDRQQQQTQTEKTTTRRRNTDTQKNSAHVKPS